MEYCPRCGEYPDSLNVDRFGPARSVRSGENNGRQASDHVVRGKRLLGWWPDEPGVFESAEKVINAPRL